MVDKKIIEDKVNKIIEGINKSPLSDSVKKEAIKIVNKESERLRPFIETSVYAAPEQNYLGIIAGQVIKFLTPLFKNNGVPGPNGRDTMRHIYECTGGRNPVNYEVCSC